MKKVLNAKFFMLLALLLVPLLLLTACDDTKYFVVDVYKDGNGSVIGPNQYQQLPEGREITLTAQEKQSENPFICWIKDKTHVASLESEYTFEVSSETAGSYTALFTQDLSQMLYAALTTVYVNRPQVTDLKVAVNIIPPQASTQVREIFNKPLTEANNIAYDGTVFAFTLLQDEFNVNVTLDYMINLINPIHEDFNFTLSRSAFVNGKTTLSDQAGNPSVTVTFELLTRSLVESVK